MDFLPVHKSARDLAGKRFGLLTAIGIVKRYRDASGCSVYLWHCVCDCGGTAAVRANNLFGGRTQSCGCIQRPNAMAGALTQDRLKEIIDYDPATGTFRWRASGEIAGCVHDRGKMKYWQIVIDRAH